MNDDQKNAIKRACANIVKEPDAGFDRILGLLALGIITPNEFRVSVGLDPLFAGAE